MCLKTIDPEIKTATKSIICFKAANFIENQRIGPFNNNIYYREGEVTKDIDIKVDKDDTVQHGYHSFNSYKDICKEFSKYIEKGIFIIPAGAKYFDGFYNDDNYLNRVSSQIVYLGPATFFNRLKSRLGLLNYK